MTRPKDPAEMKRRNRRFGDAFKLLLRCPLCQQGHATDYKLKIISYRVHTVRFECIDCGLRFTIDMEATLAVIDNHPTRLARGIFFAAWDWHKLEYVRERERDYQSDRRYLQRQPLATTATVMADKRRGQR